MDAFYAAVEILDDPALDGRPLVVGGTGARGVVASCSYEARAFGVRSAMPSGQARRLCPQAVFVAGRYDRYQEVSEGLHRIFTSVTPLVEGVALDEAFLDVGGAVRLLGPAPVIATDLRARVRTELGLSCSVGVAPNKFLAKLASEAAKPRATLKSVEPGAGVVVVDTGQELAFLHPLPVEALWGVGPATATRLHRLGITTVGDLASVPLDTLVTSIGSAHGRHLHQLAHGVDERAVEPDRETKSIGHEETYATDRFDHAELHGEVLRMADAVAGRLRRHGGGGRTVTVKVRYADFTTITRSRTMPAPIDTGHDIAGVATGILAGVDLAPGVRLLGVSISNLRGPAAAEPAEQLSLDLTGGAWSAASDAIDAVRARFGERLVGSAALLDGGGLRLKRAGDTQWGPSAPASPQSALPETSRGRETGREDQR